MVVRKPRPDIPVQAINGRCLLCGYRFAWVLVRGRKQAARVGTARRSSR
jgi:hypothetical protein